MGKTKILANDGISDAGKELLEQKGFEVFTTRVAQEQLANYINRNAIEVLLVRGATSVQKELLDACPQLRLIGRAGVGMDNIDVCYAKDKGVQVINTPEASATAVAELVFAHLLTGVRFLQDANRNMPLDGDTRFGQLKKSYAGATELRGKTLGIIGFGNIGQEVARLAIGIGMKVVFHDHHPDEKSVALSFFDGQTLHFSLTGSPLDQVLQESDFITLHLPSQKDYVIGASEIDKMKSGVGIINASRGGVLDEVALVKALDSGKVGFAGLDVFESEPTPEIRVLMHPKISLSPHVGGSTVEAQERIGIELAKKIINSLE